MTNGPPMLAHPSGLPPMQHHDINGQPAKRKQVKNACTNCQKACKKCDDARPCPRCVKYGIADSCVNSVRKERKKGIKRGPYKRRQKSGKFRKGRHGRSYPTQQYASAMRAPTLPYGFPTNLNQYGQPAYDAYSAHYYKDQMVAPQYNVVNPMYPQMAYPVLMQGQGDGGAPPPPGSHPQPHAATYQQQQQQQQQHTSLPQHYGNMVQHQPQSYQQPSEQPNGYQQQQQASTTNATAAAASDERSPVLKSEAMTPMPSASTSSGTSSSPPESTVGGAEENVDANKFAGLSQLCTAALHQDSSTSQESQQQPSSTVAQEQQPSGQEPATAPAAAPTPASDAAPQESKGDETSSGQEPAQQ
ncbi:hypothetical protein BCR42DRAFT_409886 [Absidia repens]|uniref:Zn(2)-C6 fungal-type domain-containing protein n=1 Tax=Absidia repens TaxID=90262 RepID=A0A1X2INA6_9FUNG|nr:hypothetical protein BCR42DRAFT_409886 [Absidia repens]